MEKRLVTTKAVLASPRTGSANSDRPESQTEVEEPSTGRRNSVIKMNAGTVGTVLASFNKMQMFRQRTQAMKGNVTKMTPLRKFDPDDVSREIDRLLATTLTGVTYDPKRASVLSMSLSDSIKAKVKSMKFPRYKFITMVTISSRSDQGITVASRCVWNAGSDNSATGTYTNGSLLAVATVFAIFNE